MPLKALRLLLLLLLLMLDLPAFLLWLLESLLRRSSRSTLSRRGEEGLRRNSLSRSSASLSRSAPADAEPEALLGASGTIPMRLG